MMQDSFSGKRRRRDAFTLLEVLLTLAMSVVLLILIGGAIRFFAQDLNVRDMEVRQIQVAAAVLQMIEDDLRSATHTKPIDTAALESLLTSAASQAAGGQSSGDASSTEDLSAAGLEDPPSLLTEDASVTTDLISGAAMLQTPGLVGNQFQIQLDVSRLPRLEEYMVMMDATAANIDDIPSDLKTVTYFVQSAGTIAGVDDVLTQSSAMGASSSAGGLVRRSLDRFATNNAITTGALTTLNASGDLLAPEVVSIEFAYWDGFLWQIQWNSDEMGELPLAVQVKIAVVDSPESASTLADANAGALAVQPREFTHIIRLPLAQPVDTTSDPMMEAGL